MNMKQKIIKLLVALAFAAGFAGVLAVTIPGGFVSAQEVGVDCSELTGTDKAKCEADNKEKNDNIKKQAELEVKCANIDDSTSKSVKEQCKKANLYSGEGSKCAGVDTSIIGGAMCKEGEEGGVIFSLLKWVLGIMTAGVGITAVGGIAYGALLYTTAESKPEQTKKAIGIITNVVIGLVAYALMAVLLNFIIPGGVIG